MSHKSKIDQEIVSEVEQDKVLELSMIDEAPEEGRVWEVQEEERGEGKVQEPVQDEVQEPVQEEVQEPVQEEVQEPVQEEVQEPVQEEVQEPVQEEVQEPVQEEVQEPVQEEVQEPVQEEVQEPVQDEVQKLAQEELQEPVQQSSQQNFYGHPATINQPATIHSSNTAPDIGSCSYRSSFPPLYNVGGPYRCSSYASPPLPLLQGPTGKFY